MVQLLRFVLFPLSMFVGLCQTTIENTNHHSPFASLGVVVFFSSSTQLPSAGLITGQGAI